MAIPRVGGRGVYVRGQKKGCVPKMEPQVRAPLIKVIFLLRIKFSDVGQWVGRGDLNTLPPQYHEAKA